MFVDMTYYVITLAWTLKAKGEEESDALAELIFKEGWKLARLRKVKLPGRSNSSKVWRHEKNYKCFNLTRERVSVEISTWEPFYREES